MPPEPLPFAADCTLYLRRGPDELIDITAVRDQQGTSTLSIAHGRTGQPDLVIELTKTEVQWLIQHLYSPILFAMFDMEY